VQDVCSVALNLYRQLAIYLAPVLPKLAADSGALLGEQLDRWSLSQEPLSGRKINAFSHLMQRVDPKKVQKIVDASVQAPATAESASSAGAEAPTYDDDGEALAAEPLAEECIIDDFTKVDMRVARVVKAEHVPEAKKLLKLTMSLGGGVTKQVFAGIKAAYEPDELQGRLVIMVANLKPRKMKFGMSEGMVIAASGPGGKSVLLAVDPGAKPGQRVH